MEFTTCLIVAFLYTSWAISHAQFGSTLLFLTDRLLSSFNLRTVFWELIRLNIGFETFNDILSIVELMVGHDCRINAQTSPTQLDLFLVVIFLTRRAQPRNRWQEILLSYVEDYAKISRRRFWDSARRVIGWGSIYYLSVFTQDEVPASNILGEFFDSIRAHSLHPDPALYGIAPLTVEHPLWNSPAKHMNPLDDLSEYPATSTPIRKRSPVVSVATSSTWSVSNSAASGPSPLSAIIFWCTTQLSTAPSSLAAAAKTRYLSAISTFTSKATTLSSFPSIPTGCSLSDISAADLDITLVDDADQSFELEAPLRAFGMVIPPHHYQPKVITLADLEIDDGSYLRDALGMAHSESLDGCFWPELDEFVERRSDGQQGAWYTDADEMRGWIFPGREAVPEFKPEPIQESDWDVGDVSFLVSEMVEVV